MAITDAKKVDYLWKKLGYGATKTDTNALKAAPNEAIASPLLLRGDKTWNQANGITATMPASSTDVVQFIQLLLQYKQQQTQLHLLVELGRQDQLTGYHLNLVLHME